MSCKERSESFAHSLHSKLRSLGSQDEHDSAFTWGMSEENNANLPASMHLASNTCFDYIPSQTAEENIDDTPCILDNTNILTTSNSSCRDEGVHELPIQTEINGSTTYNGCKINEEIPDARSKPCQDINENTIKIVNHANENELYEQLEQINDLEVNGCNDIGDITEEILSNALDIVDNPDSYFNSLNVEKLEIDYDNVVYITDPNEHTVEFQLLTQDLLLANNDGANDDEDSGDIIPRVRRCSSLKTGKTPPGTPGRKKIVRFADVLGLDLADVRTYLDDVPKVPNSAYDDLLNVNFNDLDVMCNAASKSQRILLALFRQPGGQPSFIEKVTINQVMLENAIVEDAVSFSIRGLVRVRNLDYDKSVHVRYSLDSWKSFSDLQALYVENSSDGFTDKFKFLLYAYSLSIGQRLEFAIRFQSKGCQYWDNNSGANYSFQCLPHSNQTDYSPVSIGMDDQIATFYYMEKCKSDENPNQSDAELTSAAVQDYIMNSLQKNIKHETSQISKAELFTIFVVLFFSIVFLYAKRTLLF